MVGGDSGARTGAKVGVVTGATRGVAQRTENRNAMYAETQARTQYENSATYQNAQHSNFSEAPPEILVTSAPVTAPVAAPAASPAAATKQNGSQTDEEAVISKNGKRVLAITYPSDWKQKKGERYVSAVSADGHAWSGIATLEGIKDKQAGIARIKQELEKYLQNINYDDPAEDKGGAQIVTGTGKAKKAGVDVVFATGVFDAAPGQLAGIAFVADKDLDDYYKEAARDICKTIRTGEN
jgi:hypothetical protein